MKALAALGGFGALTAAAMGSSVTGCGLVVLNQSASGALTMTGNATVNIPTQAVYVNSSSTTAVRTVGNATLITPDLYVVGGASFSGRSGCTGVTHLSVAPYADPLAGLAMPSVSGMPDLGGRSISGNSSVTLSPGYYSQGISISGSASVVFEPGMYLLGGQGLRITSGSVQGEGVCFVMMSGTLSIAGCSSLSLSAPTGGSMANVVICQPASNTSGLSLSGGSTTVITGSIYAPGALITLSGTSTLEGDGPLMGDLVTADRVTIVGNGQVRIGRPGMQAISLPTMPLYD
jgi:hypothetical protein